MSTIVTRSGKGSPLTHAEVDANFTNLNTDKAGYITGEGGTVVQSTSKATAVTRSIFLTNSGRSRRESIPPAK